MLTILIIIILVSIPTVIFTKKIVAHILTNKKRSKVSSFIGMETTKKIQTAISSDLKKIGQLVVPKYWANIFYKQGLSVSKYRMGRQISISKYLQVRASDMDANYYFNLVKNRMANNLFMSARISKKYWNNYIIPQFNTIGVYFNQESRKQKTNIHSINVYMWGDSCTFPSVWHFFDVIGCCIKGDINLYYLTPDNAPDMDVMETFTTCRKNVKEMSDAKHIELREGDFIYLPVGYVYQIESRENLPHQCWLEMQFETTFGDRYDKEILMLRMEQLQMRKLKRIIYPKQLAKDEVKLWWKKGWITGDIWERNRVLKNFINL